MTITKGLYTCLHASTNFRVIKIQYTDGVKIKLKGQFLTKSGLVIETKNYTMLLKNIEHWTRVKEYENN